MKITAEWLTQKNACSQGQAWFAAQGVTESDAVVKKLIAEGRYSWASWLICRLFDRRQRIQYAVFAAEQVLDIFEKKYPADKRPRLAIEAAQRCIDNNSAYAATDAYDAAADAYDAADAAANAAVDAANAAAANAAAAAANAAAAAANAANAADAANADNATAYAAEAAADAADAAYHVVAAYAAERNKMKKKILEYGQTLFTTEAR